MADSPYIYQCPVSRAYLDPLAVRRALLLGSGGEFNSWLVQQRSENPLAAFEGQSKIIPLARKAFDFSPIDRKTGEGIADEEVIAALTAFLRWLEGKP